MLTQFSEEEYREKIQTTFAAGIERHLQPYVLAVLPVVMPSGPAKTQEGYEEAYAEAAVNLGVLLWRKAEAVAAEIAQKHVEDNKDDVDAYVAAVAAAHAHHDTPVRERMEIPYPPIPSISYPWAESTLLLN